VTDGNYQFISSLSSFEIRLKCFTPSETINITSSSCLEA